MQYGCQIDCVLFNVSSLVGPQMALSRDFGVNHAKEVAGLAELHVRRTKPSASGPK